MRVSALFFTGILLITDLLIASPGHGQNISKKITMKFKDASLSDVIKAIENKGDVVIMYENTPRIESLRIDMVVKEMTIPEVLDKLVTGRSLKWSYKDDIIRLEDIDASETTAIPSGAPKYPAISPSLTSPPVSGIIRGPDGQPLAGVNIIVKGSKRGTTTNRNGNFSIDAKSQEILIISSVGYNTQEIIVGENSTVVEVRLILSSSKLDEVQIIAYGTTTKRLNTGNVSTVKAEEIEKSPVSNPLLAISGRVPGVFIEQASGVPGSGIRILIQGQNSLNNTSDPFYVVDGIPYSSRLLPGLNSDLGNSGSGNNSGGETAGNPLSFINPQDIESIDILKDADATAIYGSRAANGAILITTKKAKGGKTSAGANVQQGWGFVARRIEMLNTEQYIEMRKEAFANDGRPLPSITTNAFSRDFDINGWHDQTRYTDWQDVFLGGTAKYTNALGSLSGGNINTQYLVTVGYQKEGTVTPGDFYDQKSSVHFNLSNTSENKKFKFDFSGTYLAGKNKLAGIGGFANAAFQLAPNAPALRNEDGTLNWALLPNGTPGWSLVNPMSYLYQEYINETTNLLANASIGYQIIPGLILKSSLGYNKLETNESYIYPIGHLYPSARQTGVRFANFNDANIISWSIEPQISYVRKIGIGRLDAIVGTTIQQEDRDRVKLNAQGFSSDNSMHNIQNAATVSVETDANGVIISKYRYNALFGRLNYNIYDKYIINLTARRDGSSRFGKKNRFHNFAAIGGAWIFSEEDLLKNQLPVLSFGKLKVSYGTTGSDQLGEYRYLNLYNNFGVDVPYQGIISLQPSSQFPNYYLGWESTRKFSTGLELGFFKDKIFLSATYYKNVCSNQLQGYPLASFTGGDEVVINTPAIIHNTGLEMVLNTTNISGKFTWSTSFNFSLPQNKLVSSQVSDDFGYDPKMDPLVGHPIGYRRLYHLAGIDAETGRYIFTDKDGNPTFEPNVDTDKIIGQDNFVKFYGGLQNSFSFKGLSLDVLFQFVNASRNAT
jgi:TonB-dependent starch-binding outer membrane protein SusC